jgi:acyl-CoA thioesterase
MDGQQFLGLQPTDDPNRWLLPVVPALLSGVGALFGGCGLAAAMEAMEATTGRQTMWATAQYLSFARPPAMVSIEVVAMVVGHQTSQARAIGRVGDEEIFTVNAALGVRPSELQGQWAARPQVPRPEDCPPRVLDGRHEATIMQRLDIRLADARPMDQLEGPSADGRSSLWARLDGLTSSTTTLAILGDFVPFGISQAIGQWAGGTSLDNTMRVARRVPTEWVHLDIRVQAVADGYGHGLVHLWAEDGTLLGTASQTAVVRQWRAGER